MSEETKRKIGVSARRYWDENPWARDKQAALMRERMRKAWGERKPKPKE